MVTINFNGGTLQATGNGDSYSGSQGRNLNFIDMSLEWYLRRHREILRGNLGTNSYTNTMAYPMVHDSTLGTTPDGGLTKLSPGTLILSGGQHLYRANRCQGRHVANKR